VSTVHLLVPDRIDELPSGGNSYDRRIGDGLPAAGWQVRWHPIGGCFPAPAAGTVAALVELLAGLPDGAVLLVDGLVAACAPDALVGAAGRLRLVVLVHMLQPGDRAVLEAAAAVITTSCWSRDQLLARQPLPAEAVSVARPGAVRAEPAAGTEAGDQLLCVATLAPHKGQDLLLAALAELADRRWRCTLLGPLDRDPAFVARLRRQAAAAGIAGRIELAGPARPAELDRAYRAADLLVLPSRAESYGMVITEALGHAVPVLAAEVGGVPEAIGRATDASVPGLLVPPDDPAALAGALRRWLDDAGLRARLRAAARLRRAALAGWPDTTERIAAVLAGVAGRP
jgi:glycosyltransferase involved in cell wall biosynthesis